MFRVVVALFWLLMAIMEFAVAAVASHGWFDMVVLLILGIWALALAGEAIRK